MAVFIRQVALEMMPDKKLFNEFTPVLRNHRRIPDSGGPEEDQPAEYQQARFQQYFPVARQKQVRRDDHQRQNNSDQPLRQSRQSERETEHIPEPVSTDL